MSIPASFGDFGKKMALGITGIKGEIMYDIAGKLKILRCNPRSDGMVRNHFNAVPLKLQIFLYYANHA
jgi:hypothetical protein